MQLRDLKRFAGLNNDDSPSNLPPDDYVGALNMRTGSSKDENESGPAETLQGEVELLINPESLITYYGESIGGSFVYSGYEEIAIGSQVWMIKNWDGDYPGSKVYDDDESNADIYGRLYSHDQIMNADFCPLGWHVPTEAEIDILLAYLGGDAVAGGKLKNVGTELWADPNTGAVDSAGFHAVPGGEFDNVSVITGTNPIVIYYGTAIGGDFIFGTEAVYSLLGTLGLLWLQDDGAPIAPKALNGSSIVYDSFKANWKAADGATGYYLDVSLSSIFASFIAGYNNKDVGNVLFKSITGLLGDTNYYYRVRAYNEVGTSGNSSTITLKTAPTVTDADGNVYGVVTIGAQQWMIENLKSTKYNDGTLIPNITDDALWIADTAGAYCWYDNNLANKSVYGALYNWYAVNTGKLAPTGWRIPTTADWDALIAFIGADVCLKLREVGYEHWIETIIPHPGQDLYGYKLRGAGQRSNTGGYGNQLYLTQVFHAAADLKASYILDDIHDIIYTDMTFYKMFGFSVRCMRDTP